MTTAIKSRGVKPTLLTALAMASLPWLADFIVFIGVSPERIFNEAGILLFNSLWSSAPFWIFAIIVAITKGGANQVKLPLIAGALMTIGFWLYFAIDGLLYQLGPGGSGANIGAGIILMALPFLTGAIMLGLYLSKRKETAHD